MGGDGNDMLIGSDMDFSFSSLEGGAGNDTLRAGTAGASLADFGGGNDRLVGNVGYDSYFSGAGKDLLVWGSQWNNGGFGEFVQDFEDGVDLIDLRGTGLDFSDLVIDDSGGFSVIVTSTAGQVEVGFNDFEPVTGRLNEADFLFG
jgi:Ca2+-binding RTX toxin-like protein